MNFFKKTWDRIKTFITEDNNYTDIDYYNSSSFSSASSSISYNTISWDSARLELDNNIRLVDDIIEEENIPKEYRNDIIWNVLNRPVEGRWELEKYNILKSRIRRLLEEKQQERPFIFKYIKNIKEIKDCQPISAEEFLTEEEMEIS